MGGKVAVLKGSGGPRCLGGSQVSKDWGGAGVWERDRGV